MVEYSNRPIPEGINTGRTHPLKELARLLLVVVGGLALLFWLLGLVADWASLRVPFEYERQLVDRPLAGHADDPEVGAYLQGLTERLAARMELPEAMTLRVHYLDDNTVNAGATLGGQLLVYRGLLERLPNENALAMVLAHEIGHVKLRHPVRSLGRGLVLAIAMAALSGAGGNGLGDAVVGETGTLTVLSFSRDQEAAADAEALQAVARLYGHVGGATALFEVLLEQERSRPLAEPIGFLRSHPLGPARIEAVAEQAGVRGWPLHGELTPLPAFVPRQSE